MKLWVDYRNWRGMRDWREIRDCGRPYLGDYHDEAGPEEKTWVMDVKMVDRGGARRTLKLTNIYGFYVGEFPHHG